MDSEVVRGLLLNLLAEYEALQVENRYFRQQYGQPPELLGARRDENSSAMSALAASSNSQPEMLTERSAISQLATSSAIINIQPANQMELLELDEPPVRDWADQIDSKVFGAERHDPSDSKKRPAHGSESARHYIMTPACTGATHRTFKRLKITTRDYKFNDQGILLKLVEHWLFENLMGFIILLNVAFMGYAADYAMHNLQNPEPLGVKITELIFFIGYSIELSIKMIARGRSFFRPPHRGWNLFDTVLVAHGLYEQFVTFVEPAAYLAGNVSVLRSLRLMKALRMLRVVRLRAMFELRIILISIMGSVRSMFWSVVLIAVVLYMFALVIVQAFAKHLSSQEDSYGQAATERHTIDQINEHWGSIGSAMMSLFACSTGGSDWREVAKPMNIMGPVLYAIFWFYIAFFIFVILNTITALFVETTMAISMRDYQVRIQTELDRKDEYKAMLQHVFDKMDDTGDGLVSIEEFSRHMEDTRMSAFLSCLGLDIFDALHFFRLMSAGGTQPVDCEQFVTNCIRMRGQAMSMDVHELLTRMRHFNKVADEKLEGTLSIAMELAGHFNIEVPELIKTNLFRPGSLSSLSSHALHHPCTESTGRVDMRGGDA